jgi:hypothetical protein
MQHTGTLRVGLQMVSNPAYIQRLGPVNSGAFFFGLHDISVEAVSGWPLKKVA